MNRNFVAARNTSTPILSRADGQALFAVGQNCVMGINIWPLDIPYWSDDDSAYRLFANAAALPCTVPGPQAPPVQPAYTG